MIYQPRPQGKKSPKGKESSLEENITPKPEEKFTDFFSCYKTT